MGEKENTAEDGGNGSETKIPDAIKSAEDLRSYVKKCFLALTDPKNYDSGMDGIEGFSSLTEIAAKVLQENGFGKYATHWTTHPFHWLMVGQGIVDHYQPRAHGRNGESLWVLQKDMPGDIAEKLTGLFMDGFIDKRGKRDEYGTVMFARIEGIREHPQHRPYD